MFTIKVNAGSVSMKVTANKSSVIVGNNIVVTITVSSSEALGSWLYTLNYDKNKFSFVAGSYALSETDAGDGSKKSVKYTYTFKAKASGSAKFSLSNYQASVWSESGYATVNATSTTVKIMTQAELEATYSKNNYLKSLTVEGYNINFNKETLEYNLELENHVTSLNISAQVEDSKSSIVGGGTINVSEGVNKITITVTAQNGNTKTYVINATVKELAPVNVKIGDKEYSVIRKEGVIDPPNNYEKTTVNINNEEVLAYQNEITKYTLLGLKDSEGNSNYYIYNEEDNSFTLYKELSFNKLNIILKEYDKKMPENYQKTTIAINENEITAYKIKESSAYSLIYGMNVDTGETNLYLYDEVEHTIQRYTDEEVQIYQEKVDNYMLYLFIIIIADALIILIVAIVSIIKHQKKNKFKLNS